jgi:hypothetical protein
MGRRRRDGQRRAAKVEARRRHREATARPPRGARPRGAGTAPLPAEADATRVSAPSPAEATEGSRAPRPDHLGSESRWDDDLDDRDDDDRFDEVEGEEYERLAAFARVCAEVRDAVEATLDRRDPEVARTFVATRIGAAGGHAPETGPSDGRLDGPHVALVLQVWLIVSQRTQHDTDLATRAGGWATELLGRSDPSLERVTRMLEAARAPVPVGGSRAEPSDIPALIWLTAGIVAVGGAGGLRWLEGLDATSGGSDC